MSDYTPAFYTKDALLLQWWFFKEPKPNTFICVLFSFLSSLSTLQFNVECINSFQKRFQWVKHARCSKSILFVHLAFHEWNLALSLAEYKNKKKKWRLLYIWNSFQWKHLSELAEYPSYAQKKAVIEFLLSQINFCINNISKVLIFIMLSSIKFPNPDRGI